MGGPLFFVMIQIQTVTILSNGQVIEVIRMITETQSIVKPTRISKFLKNFENKGIEMRVTFLYYFGLFTFPHRLAVTI